MQSTEFMANGDSEVHMDAYPIHITVPIWASGNLQGTSFDACGRCESPFKVLCPQLCCGHGSDSGETRYFLLVLESSCWKGLIRPFSPNSFL